jgi:hypothetical protein
LKTFGEMGIVTIHEDKAIRGKLSPRGKPCMFVGYPDNTTGDVYRMLNLKTQRVIKTRDIMWLNETYGQYMGRNKNSKEITIPINIGNNLEADENTGEKIIPDPIPSQPQIMPQTANRELRNLHTFYNPILDTTQSGRENTPTSNIQPPTPNSIDRGGEAGSKVFDVEKAKPENAIETNEFAAPKPEEPPDEEDIEPTKFSQVWDHPDDKKETTCQVIEDA